MDVRFQRNILKWLVQNRRGVDFLPLMEERLFDLAELKAAFQLMGGYLKEYKKLPKRAESLLQYFRRESRGQTISDDLVERITLEIEACYDLLSDPEIVQDSVVEYAQSKAMREILKDYRTKVDELDGTVLNSLLQDVNKVIDMARQGDEAADLGKLLLRHHHEIEENILDGHPCCYAGLNALTAKNGFLTPELIVFLGQPKSFKTGLLLNIALGYVRAGLNVYYVDCENSKNSIVRRMRQAMVKATYTEMRKQTYSKELDEIVLLTSKMGGDFGVDYYAGNSGKTIADVERNLQWYKEQYNWVPDVIIYDYLDLMDSTNRYVKNEQEKIQKVYFEAIDLNSRLGTFCFTGSQVNRNAVNKEDIDMTAFAKDFGKAANCHAAFALIRTADMMETGEMHIKPIAQREGVPPSSHNKVRMKLNESRMMCEEIDEEAIELIRKRAGKTDLKAEAAAYNALGSNEVDIPDFDFNTGDDEKAPF